MNKTELKKQLKDLGINIVKGNYVKRKDLEEIVLGEDIPLEATATKELDLTSFDDAKEWVLENTDIEYAEEDEEDEDDDKDDENDIYKNASNEMMDDRIHTYMSKYAEVIDKPFITVYRAVVLENISKLDFNNIGIHWSFEKDGAGAYGLNRDMKENEKEYILTAKINPKDIDWEYGFTSFMYYGEDQWECAVDGKVTVIAIDGLSKKEKIKLPLKGKTGEKTVWED